MPQPLRSPHNGVEFEANPLAKRPDAADSLANAIAVWNLFEWELAAAFSVAIGFYLPGIEGWEPTNHPQAFDFMDTIAGLGTRLELLDTALRRVAAALVPDYAAIRPEIRKRAGKRADLAHGRWGTNGRYPEGIIKDNQDGNELWIAKDFQDCADQFNELRKLFSTFHEKLRDEARKRPGLRKPPAEFSQARSLLRSKGRAAHHHKETSREQPAPPAFLKFVALSLRGQHTNSNAGMPPVTHIQTASATLSPTGRANEQTASIPSTCSARPLAIQAPME